MRPDPLASDCLASDCKFTPYWWDVDGVDLAALAETGAALPERVDVAVVGGGYTGLSAALTLARAGRAVAVLDAEVPGFGCSSRNGGLVGPSLHKLGLAGLSAKYGSRKADDILRESMAGLEFLFDLIARERIDCHLVRTGRFRGAISPRGYEAMARETEALKKAVGLDADMVPRAEQGAEIGSDHYHGGVVSHGDGFLQPALYAAGLAARCRLAGAGLFGQARVESVSRDGQDFELRIGGRRLKARNVLIATNGYTEKELPGFRRRLIPLRSGMIATEPLSGDMMRSISPKNRGFSDDSRLVYYYRPSPDGRRLLFGGRAFDIADRPRAYGRDLHAGMTRIFPQLRAVAVSHVWSGVVAYTFDHAPHLGEFDGIHYAMGYCGSGVGRATYFGHKIALRILGHPESRTAFDDLPFETRPFYNGYPWFVPFVLRWHALIDRMGR